MASAKFNCFVVGLIMFIFLARRDSTAYTHQATEEMVRIANGIAFLAVEASPALEKENLDDAPKAPDQANNGKHGGRKMVEKMALGKERVRKESDINGGFMAFSADYHVPKPHPPKNN